MSIATRRADPAASTVNRTPVVRTAAPRRPFSPSPAAAGPYRLPAPVLGRLCAVLGAFRNADAAFALAVFLGRFWSAPGRLDRAFPVDRRALAEHHLLGLSEWQVRGALKVLEHVGFVEREVVAGPAYKRTATGPQRRPITFKFGREYAPAFVDAVRRSRAAQEARKGQRRPITPPQPAPACTGRLAAPHPTRKSAALLPKGEVLTGQQKRGSPGERITELAEPNQGLEAALARLQAGIFAPGCKNGGTK